MAHYDAPCSDGRRAAAHANPVGMPAAGPGLCPCPASPCPYLLPRGAGALLGAAPRPRVRSARRPCRAGTSPPRGLCTRRACRKSRPVQGGTASLIGGCATILRLARGCRQRPSLASSCRGAPPFQSSPYMHRGIRLLHRRPSSTFRLLRCQPVERPQWNRRCDRSRVDRTKGVYLYSVETPRRTAVRPCANLEGQMRGFFDAAARRRLRHGQMSKRLPLCPRRAGDRPYHRP